MPDEPTPPEATTPNSESDPRYDSAGVPTFESVREKIEPDTERPWGQPNSTPRARKAAGSKISTRSGSARQPNG